jgi:hypothetical protein
MPHATTKMMCNIGDLARFSTGCRELRDLVVGPRLRLKGGKSIGLFAATNRDRWGFRFREAHGRDVARRDDQSCDARLGVRQ